VATYTFPTSAELRLVEQSLLPRLEENREVFKFFPRSTADGFLVRWHQRDDYLGLQQVRGLNGEPPKVIRTGFKEYQMVPGVYGEQIPLDEQELTTRAREGTWADPIRLDDMVAYAHEHLLQRELDRIELILWTLLSTGTFSVSNAAGSVTHTDSYSVQTYSAAVAWGTSATSTPLADFRAVQLLSRGKSVSFGAGAKAYMNRTTLNQLLSNTNNNDLAGRRVSGLLSVLNLGEVNAILQGEDLPEIVPYDLGYRDEANTFQLFIANNKVVVVGKRPNGEPLGEYQQVTNIHNPDMGAGPYSLVQDTLEQQQVPRQVIVHRGHSGGPAIYFPGGFVAMTV
jgi:hypothetical protein